MYFPTLSPRACICQISKLICGLLLLNISVTALAVDIELPDLGDASSAVISSQQEYELGQKILKLYRAQMPTSSDPIIYSYLENLIKDLAQYSELPNKNFDLLVIESPQLNAFAAPGRVIGVNTGIFLYTETEDQLASIITHELAHLSQRHIARQMIEQKKNSVPVMAGILAGIILAATGNADAGMAAITATQAAALDSRLRYSRSYEQEADRVGFQTMLKAERNPNAAGDMFEVMLRRSRFDRRPPEFLSTHPISESRISDARNRAIKYPRENYPDNLDFHLVAARVKLQHEKTAHQAIKRFETEINSHEYVSEESREASRYGLVLALTAAGETDKAREELNKILQVRPNKIVYQLASTSIDLKDKKYPLVLKELNKLLGKHPDNHAITIHFAEALMEAGEYKYAEQLLSGYVRTNAKDDYVWYLLAEVYGLVGKILDVHRARAEYYILNGVYDRALNQLENAQRLIKDDAMTAALVEQRLIDVRGMMEEADI